MEMGSHGGQWRVAALLVVQADEPSALGPLPPDDDDDDPADGSRVALGGIPSSLSRLGAADAAMVANKVEGAARAAQLTPIKMRGLSGSGIEDVGETLA